MTYTRAHQIAVACLQMRHESKESLSEAQAKKADRMSKRAVVIFASCMLTLTLIGLYAVLTRVRGPRLSQSEDGTITVHCDASDFNIPRDFQVTGNDGIARTMRLIATGPSIDFDELFRMQLPQLVAAQEEFAKQQAVAAETYKKTGELIESQ